MFNTDECQSHPDYVMEETQHTKVNTNQRYRFFRQRHFTAGDYEQFLQFWDRTNPTAPPPEAYHVLHSIHPNCKLPMYSHLHVEDVFYTFCYIFNKFKKGVFLKIVDGAGKVFLPFSKVDYKNEWHSRIRIHPRYINVVGLMTAISKMEKRELSPSRVHKDVRSWYGNNGLVRLEYPISEGDNGVNMIRDMFVCLIRERKLPSVEVFVNKRDFPLLKKNGTEAYDSFFGDNQRMLSLRREKYAPILSMTTSDDHADIPIPTWEDWCRVSFQEEGKLFGKEFRRFPSTEELNSIAWADKTPIAVFRGASTGLGTTVETNPRLYFSWLSHKGKRDTDGLPFLDAGITKWNLRPRKSRSSPYLDTIRIDELPFDVVPAMSILDQARYRYILHLPGHSVAYRLSTELTMGSVILMYPCQWKLWYSDMLHPYVHYVPLDPTDPEDVFRKIRWCKENDGKCQEIVKNARMFAERFLSRKGILDYLQDTLWTIYRQSGMIIHATTSIMDIIHTQERMFLKTLTTRKIQEHAIKMHLYRLVEDKQCASLSNHLMSILLFNVDTFNCKIIKELKTNKVHVIEFGGRKFLRKRTTDHEAAIGYMQLNVLAESIPNFVYTFFNTPDGCVYTDYVPGCTLEDVINDPSTTVSDILFLFKMICLSIQHAQQHCGFIHMDLYPWNIIIKTLPTPERITYQLGGGKRVTVVTDRIPVFIDYGRSHVVYEGKHFYNVVPFRLCAMQDVVSIVFSSFHIYLSRFKLSMEQVALVLETMRFFAESLYMSREHVRSISCLKAYLREKKKFSNMLMDEKRGLDRFYPLDFFQHMEKRTPDRNHFQMGGPDMPLQMKDVCMSPFLFHPVVIQALFLEVTRLLEEDWTLFFRSMILHILEVNRCLRKEKETALRNLRILVSQWCLRQVRECYTGHIPEWEEAMTSVAFPPLKMNIPCEQDICQLPLIGSHPFYDNVGHQGYDIGCGQKDWYELYSVMVQQERTGDLFALWTRAFRNFTISRWSEYTK